MAKRARRSGCPIATSLDIFGDRWSLLIVRDLMFKDRRTYGEFLAAGEDVATNVLAQRLEQLECAGLIERRVDDADRRRSRYRLTAKGMDLAPMLVEMVLWAAAHEETDAPPAVVAAMKRDRTRFIAGLRARWKAEA